MAMSRAFISKKAVLKALDDILDKILDNQSFRKEILKLRDKIANDDPSLKPQLIEKTKK